MHDFHFPYGQYPSTATEPYELTDTTKRVRKYFWDSFMEKCKGPDIPQIMGDLNLSQHDLWEALVQLQHGVQVMFVPGTENLLRMPPFSYGTTRHHATLDDGRSWWLGCAGESCAAHMHFPDHTMTVKSYCPDCWETITTVWKNGELLSVEPSSTLIHIGIHPDEWRNNFVVTCDNINFFKSKEHIAIWEAKFPNRKGATLPAQKGFKWVEKEARTRYWTYDQGPGVTGSKSITGTTVQAFKKQGFDVTNWEK
jgi:hypothetical protein